MTVDERRRSLVAVRLSWLVSLCLLFAPIVHADLVEQDPQHKEAGHDARTNMLRRAENGLKDFVDNDAKSTEARELYGRDTCTKTVVDFSTDASGNPLSGGMYLENEFQEFGLELSSSGGYGTRPRLFDTSYVGNEKYGDADLGSPNERCTKNPGPGKGEGGEPDAPGANCDFLGNVLIIQEDNPDKTIPDDNAKGGEIVFTFANDGQTVVHEIGLLDVNYRTRIVVETESEAGAIKEHSIKVPHLGDNSVQTVKIDLLNVVRLRLVARRSAAVTFISFCRPTDTPTTLPPPTVPTRDPPPQCIDALIDFSESSGGDPLYGGMYLEKEFEDEFGLTLSSSGGYGSRPRLFDTSQVGNKKYGDPDLGSPNEDCYPPGPGKGQGGAPGADGENCDFLGNVLIIQEDNGDKTIPDDNKNGGVVTFNFARPVDVHTIGLLDIDYAADITVDYEKRGRMKQTKIDVPLLGDNSAQVVRIQKKNVFQLRLNLSRSGAVTFISFCYTPGPGTTPPPPPPTQPNVIIFMADDLGQDSTRLYNPDDSELVEERRQMGNPFPENAPMPWLEQKLAKYGVSFRNAWAMPVCSPTRSARSTGQYASTTGLGQVVGRFTPRLGAPGSRFEGVEFPPSQLDPRKREDNPRFPDLMQRLVSEAGYKTYKLGKWHEAETDYFDQDVVNPLDLSDKEAARIATQGKNDILHSGWHEYYGLLSGLFGGINGNGYGGGLVSIEDQPDGAKLEDEETDAIHLIDSRSKHKVGNVPDARNPTCEFADSAIVTRGIQLIEEAKKANRPFFLEYSMLAPHFQYEVPPGPWDTELHARLRRCYNGELGGWRTLTTEHHSEVIVQIIAAFNYLNETTKPSVEEVRDNLEFYGPKLYPDAGTRAPGDDTPEAMAKRRAAFKGLVSYLDLQMARLTEHVDWDNTYIIFLGDNGSQGGQQFDIIEPPNDPTRSKATVYRNGREVPFVFAGGKEGLKGVWRNDLVNVVDLYATVLSLFGIPQPEATKESSFSFASVLTGGKSKRRINVSEQYPSTATVGGTNGYGTGRQPAQPAFGPGSRAVGDDRYSLLAFNRVNETGIFVCKEGSGTKPEDDCLDFDTGIYEHVVDVNFYDTKEDPLEENPLQYKDLDSDEAKAAFLKLCNGLNDLSRKAVYYQNGEICDKDKVSTPMMEE